MPTATMTSKGQLTIPKEVRDLAHLKQGDRLEVSVREADGVIEIKRRSRSVLDLVGVLKPRVRGVTVEQMSEAIREQGAKA
jgi:antitoxin PrlF